MHANQHKPTIFFLMGPTASGKTVLITELYAHYPVDIISVDSAMIYRGMDIGTAKPTIKELEQTPHRLIDIKDPTEAYSAADFRFDAINEINEIIRNGRIPLLVGGTMLYFKALLEGLSPLPPADPDIRKQIEQQANLMGWQSIHQQLQHIDPVSAKRIHPNDPQRLSRALEVYLISGHSLTKLTEKKADDLPFTVKQFALVPVSREVLHQRIEQRFLTMLDKGFEQEVRHLYDRGDLHANLPAIRCVGYRQMWHYLSHEISYDDMIFKAICATRQLAKRQMTWLRSWENLIWLEDEHSIQILKNALQSL